MEEKVNKLYTHTRGRERHQVERKLLMKYPKELLICNHFNVKFKALPRKLLGWSLSKDKPYTEHLKRPFCLVQYLWAKLNLSILPGFSLLWSTSLVLDAFPRPLAFLDICIYIPFCEPCSHNSPHTHTHTNLPPWAWHSKRLILDLRVNRSFLHMFISSSANGEISLLTVRIRWNNKSKDPRLIGSNINEAQMFIPLPEPTASHSSINIL